MRKKQNERMPIDLLIVFDTMSIIQNTPQPSQDKTKPTAVKSNGQYVFSTEATKDRMLSVIPACPGDTLKIRGTSVYQNSQQAAIIYQVKNLNRKNIKEMFTADPVSRDQAVQPDPKSYDGLPALHVKENFISMDTEIQNTGRKKYRVCFALYDLANDGETQNLIGYFYWDLKMEIVDEPVPER